MDSNNQIQRIESQQIKAITKENWPTALALLPIKADSPPSEVLRLGTPEVSTFNRGCTTPENGIQVFEVLVQAIVKFYGTGWGAQQREVAELMFSKYYWLHMAEIRQFSLKAKAGDFNKKDSITIRDNEGKFLGTEEWDGKLYGPLTPAVLMKWMERFATDSTAARAGIDWDRKPLPPMSEEERAGLVKEETIKATLEAMMDEFGLVPDYADKDRREEIYRQEKIKQRQRDAARRQADIEDIDSEDVTPQKDAA